MRKVHTLLEMKDNNDIKNYLDYLCIDLNYVEEQRNNLLSKHKNLVQELKTCKERLLVLKQAKFDLYTMQYVNTEILKENQNLRKELKELTTITETWLNSSNKVNQCISEQVPTQKKRILGVDQLTKDPSSSGKKDLVFVISSANDTKVSIPSVERPWLSEAEGFILPNHYTGRILPAESQRNTTDPPVAVTDSSTTNYDSTYESSVCSTPLLPLEKLGGVEPISRPNTIKSILKSNSTFKAEALKGIIINEPSLVLTKGNNSASASKVNSAPAGKLMNVKIKDDPPLAIVIKELNNLKLQISKNQSSYFRNSQPQQVSQNALQNKYKTQLKKGCELFRLNNHLSENCYKVLFCKKCKRTDHRTYDHAKFMSTINMTQYLKSLGGSSSISRTPRPSKRFFPPCTHCGQNQETFSMSSKDVKLVVAHFIPQTDHYDIEWFRRGKELHAKNVEALKSKKTGSSNAKRSKTPTRCLHKDHLGKFDENADKGFSIFYTRRLQTEETYHITFDESPDAIKIYKTFKPYGCPEPVVLEIEVSSDQNGQADQNDQNDQTDEILNDDQSEHSNHTNDEQIIDNLPSTEDIQISEHLSSPNAEDTLVHDTIPIPHPSLSIPSMVSPAFQDSWSQEQNG
ncbi:hypothetical protein Tco_1353161 [Tanacetum coccineum]